MDWICGYSLKLASKILIQELKYIINLSIRTGRFCKEWKKAKVIPIFKQKGTRNNMKFYRPVSNISEVSKLAEMAVYDQIYAYFKSKNLFHKNHHGFLKNHSTVTAIQQMREFCFTSWPQCWIWCCKQKSVTSKTWNTSIWWECLELVWRLLRKQRTVCTNSLNFRHF